MMKWSDPIRAYPSGSTLKTMFLSRLGGDCPQCCEDNVDRVLKYCATMGLKSVHRSCSFDKSHVFDVN